MATINNLLITPTFECAGIVCDYTGTLSPVQPAYADLISSVGLPSADGVVLLEYRELGGLWKLGFPMWCDTRLSQFKGSIFWLKPNTSYEVRLTGNNELIGTFTTRNDNPPSNGNEVLVASTGDLTTALSSLTPRTKILLQSGNYNTNIFLQNVSGLVDNYITIGAAPNASPVLNGNVDFYLCNYLRLSGLAINGQVQIRGTDSPNFVYPYGNIIEDCAIKSSVQPIKLSYGVSGTLIQRNDLTINLSQWSPDISGVWWWKLAGEKGGRGDATKGDFVIRYNKVHGPAYDGFGGGEEDDFKTANNCDVYGNEVDYAYDDCVSVEGGMQNSRVWGNLCKQSAKAGIANCPVLIGPAYNFRNISNLTVQDRPDGSWSNKLGNNTLGRLYLFHNTSYGSHSMTQGPTATNNGLANLISRNNIWQGGRYVVEFGHSGDWQNNSMDYDLLYSSDPSRFVKVMNTQYTNIAAFRNFGQEIHGIQAEPKFKNPANLDFSLDTASPAINKGVILPFFNDSQSPYLYKDTAPDMGAIEYNEGVQPMVTFTGQVSAQAGVRPVSITITQPGGTVETISGATDANRNYSILYVQSMPGDYSAIAKASEDALYLEAISQPATFSIASPPPTKLPSTITLLVNIT